jgi:hypothetical protein
MIVATMAHSLYLSLGYKYVSKIHSETESNWIVKEI